VCVSYDGERCFNEQLGLVPLEERDPPYTTVIKENGCELFRVNTNSEGKVMLPPRIIGRFVGKDRGLCSECREKYPLDELALVARSDFDNTIFAFDIYCYDCFSDFSGGDDKAWKEAHQSSTPKTEEELPDDENGVLPKPNFKWESLPRRVQRQTVRNQDE